MNEFACLIGGVFSRFERRRDRPADAPHKGVAWYLVRREFGAAFEGVKGDEYVIQTVDPATLPPPVPSVVSDRQFFEELAYRGTITQQEAEDAVATGMLPAAMTDLVAMLPEQAQFSARMMLKGATQFFRNHEMTDTLAWLYGWTPEQTDDVWRAASAR